MKLSKAMKELKAAGTAQNRKTYARHGYGENMFGVSFKDLARLEKEIGTDHALAVGLWNTGNMDAMLLATRIADPAQVKSSELDAWIKGVDNHVPVAQLVRRVVAKTKFARTKADKWIKSKHEYLGQAGWNLVTALASGEAAEQVDDGYLAERLEQIEAGIHSAKNRTRYAMNNALIAIGGYRPKLRKKAIAAAKRIGEVEVDHGDTSCKTPEAVSYIGKMVAHQDKKKKAATKRAAAKPRKSAKKTGRPRPRA